MKISHFPDFSPDETVYSVACRYMDRMQFPSHLIVAQNFFNRSEVRATTGLPSFLECLIQALPPYHTYTLDNIIEQHTLFPFYLPFCNYNMWQENARYESPALKRFARISQSSRTEWLKYCPLCVENDRFTYGECYWHRIHQIPRITVCPIHEVALENSTVSALITNKLPRFYSAEQAIGMLSSSAASAKQINPAMLQLARNAMWLLEHPTSKEQSYIRQQYLAWFAHCGFITATSKLRFKQLKVAILDYYSASFLADLECDILTSQENWLRNWTSIKNPLHHLLLIQFLCETVQTFFTEPLSFQAPFGDGPWPCLNPLCIHYKERLILSYKIRQSNGSQLVAVFTCLCGFSYSRTGPDINDEAIFRVGQVVKYGDIWDQQLIAYWQDQALSITQIARLMHRSTECIRRQAARLGLPFEQNTFSRGRRPQIYQDHIAEHRDEYRSLLEEGLKIPPSVRNKKEVKAFNKALAWLKLHDLEWFKEHYPAEASNNRNKNLLSQNIQFQIDRYLSIDADLAKTIKKIANEIMADSSFPIRVTQRLLVTRIGDAALLHLSQKSNVAIKGLPLTLLELGKCSETSTAFIWRKLRWAVQRCLDTGEIPSYTSFLKCARLSFGTATQTNIQPLVRLAYSSICLGMPLSVQIPEI